MAEKENQRDNHKIGSYRVRAGFSTPTCHPVVDDEQIDTDPKTGIHKAVLREKILMDTNGEFICIKGCSNDGKSVER